MNRTAYAALYNGREILYDSLLYARMNYNYTYSTSWTDERMRCGLYSLQRMQRASRFSMHLLSGAVSPSVSHLRGAS